MITAYIVTYLLAGFVIYKIISQLHKTMMSRPDYDDIALNSPSIRALESKHSRMLLIFIWPLMAVGLLLDD